MQARRPFVSKGTAAVKSCAASSISTTTEGDISYNSSSPAFSVLLAFRDLYQNSTCAASSCPIPLQHILREELLPGAQQALQEGLDCGEAFQTAM